MKKKKILFILPKTEQGGAERQMLYLIDGIDKNLFKVYLGLLYECDATKDEFNNIKGVETLIFKKKNKFDIKIYFKIASFIRKNKIDIIQTFLGNHHAYIPSVIARRGLPIGGIRHTYGGMNKSKWYAFKEFTIPNILTRISKFILVSNCNAGRDIYINKGLPNRSIFVIPNGIDYEIFSNGKAQQIIDRHGLDGKIVLGIVSRLVPGKGHRRLIENIGTIIDEYDNATLLIVGDGPCRNKLEKITKERGVEDKVIFTGNRKDIPDYLAAMDIFLFPSKFPDGWPNVVGEAMAAGLPVLCFQAGDIKYIINNGIDGIITPPDMKDFIKKIIELISDEETRNKLGNNAHQKISATATLNIMVDKYQYLYNKLQ